MELGINENSGYYRIAVPKCTLYRKKKAAQKPCLFFFFFFFFFDAVVDCNVTDNSRYGNNEISCSEFNWLTQRGAVQRKNVF